MLLLGLVAGGAGAAAAEQCDINTDVHNDIDRTTIINDNDLVDIDDTLNNISTNVLGIQTDDSQLTIGSADDSVANGQMY